MLQIKNLHVSIEGNEILRGIDLEIPTGAVHAIMVAVRKPKPSPSVSR